MFEIVLLGLLASASAAPYYHHDSHYPPSPFRHGHEGGLSGHYFSNDIFDTRRFWMELSREMAMFDQLLVDFEKRFPSSVSSEGIDTETNEYKVTIPLAGYEEKDIIVKAREGILMVQAVQKPEGGIGRSYLDIRSLPDIVNVNGSWTYNEGVLKIVFPLLSKTTTKETTTEIITVAPELSKPESREEIDNQTNDNRDADVGVNRGDTDKEAELLTNEIPKRQPVEATTYAVDLKDEFEFVPVRY